MAGWIERHDQQVRARLEQGDEDTIVNWMLFGTSFTSRPRAVLGAVESGTAADRELVLRRTIELISARLDDLLTALAAPGTDERRLFARALLQRRRASLRDRCRQGSGAKVSARGGHPRGQRTGPDRSGTWRDERRRPRHRVRPAVPAVPHARPVARHVAHSQLFGRAGAGGDEGARAAQARFRETCGDRRSRARLRGQGRRLRHLSATDAAAIRRARFAPAAGSCAVARQSGHRAARHQSADHRSRDAGAGTRREEHRLHAEPAAAEEHAVAA